MTMSPSYDKNDEAKQQESMEDETDDYANFGTSFGANLSINNTDDAMMSPDISASSTFVSPISPFSGSPSFTSPFIPVSPGSISSSTFRPILSLSKSPSRDSEMGKPTSPKITTEQDIMFEEFPMMNESGDMFSMTEKMSVGGMGTGSEKQANDGKMHKKQSRKKKKKSSKRRHRHKDRRGRRDDESADPILSSENNLVDQVIDYLSPDEEEDDKTYEDDDDDTFVTAESEPPTVLSLFLSHGRAKHEVIEELQDTIFEKLGCQLDDWEDSDDEEDERFGYIGDGVGDSSTFGGESKDNDDSGSRRKTVAAEKRSKRVAARRKARRIAANAKKLAKRRSNRNKAQHAPIQVQMSLDEDAQGLEAMACFDYKVCYDACNDGYDACMDGRACDDEALFNDLIDPWEDNDDGSIAENDQGKDSFSSSSRNKKGRTRKSRDEDGNVVLSRDKEKRESKRTFRASLHYLSSVLRFNRDPHTGRSHEVVKTKNDQERIDENEEDIDNVDSYIPTHLKPIKETEDEETSKEPAGEVRVDNERTDVDVEISIGTTDITSMATPEQCSVDGKDVSSVNTDMKDVVSLETVTTEGKDTRSIESVDTKDFVSRASGTTARSGDTRTVTTYETGDTPVEANAYSKSILDLDEQLPEETDDEVATMMQNFEQLRKDFFPEMSNKRVVKEFNDFLKERRFSKEAQTKILAKAKIALACQNVDMESALNDNVDDYSNDVDEDTILLPNDPPGKPKNKPHPIANSSVNESFASSIEVFDTQGSGSTKVFVDDSFVDEIEKEVAKADVNENSFVDEIENEVAKVDVHENAFVDEIENDVAKVDADEKQSDPVLHVKPTGQNGDPIEDDKPSSARSTRHKERKRDSFGIKFLSRFSVGKKRTQPKVKAGENAERNTQHKSKDTVQTSTPGAGRSRSISLFHKNKKNQEEKTIDLPMESRGTEDGKYTGEVFPIPSFPTRSFQSKSTVNVFDWATGDTKQVEETCPFDETLSVLQTGPFDGGTMNPYESNKSKRDAWRKKTLQQKDSQRTMLNSKPPLEVKMVGGSVTTRIGPMPSPRRSTQAVNDAIHSPVKKDNWADFSSFPGAGSQDGNTSTDSPVAVEEFDSLLTSHAVNNDWGDAWSPSTQSLETPDKITVVTASGELPSMKHQDILTEQFQSQTMGDSSISTYTTPEQKFSSQMGFLHTPQRSNKPVVRRRVPSGTEDSFSLTPGEVRIPSWKAY